MAEWSLRPPRDESESSLCACKSSALSSQTRHESVSLTLYELNTISSSMPSPFLYSDEFCLGLGRPYSAGDSYAIYCADCLPALHKLPSGLFGLTITSPPYNIGK